MNGHIMKLSDHPVDHILSLMAGSRPYLKYKNLILISMLGGLSEAWNMVQSEPMGLCALWAALCLKPLILSNLFDPRTFLLVFSYHFSHQPSH